MNPIRQSGRGTKQLIKSPNADSDQPHHKPVVTVTVTERSPKLKGDRRSPRGNGNGNAARSSDPSNQKKLGNRVADLESQLGQAQGELKILKHQLASTRAQKRVPIKIKSLNEGSEQIQPETDVFEVPFESTVLINKVDLSPPSDQPETRNDVITSLKAEINDKDTEMEISKRKKIAMKTKIDDLNSDMGLVRTKETEMMSKMNQLFGDLEQSKSVEAELKAKLETLEAEKNAMETEMKTMRVQMEQWRKAAEAAAIVLSAEVETNRGIESIIADDDTEDDGISGGKKKGSGIRKIGDMWKKKVQK